MTKNKKKLIVDHYSPKIYPIDLYVVKNYTVDDIKRLFNLTENDLSGTWDALTISGVKYKNDDTDSVVILLSECLCKNKDMSYKINTCSHEALHYTTDLMVSIGHKLTPNEQEPYCYLQGWATECVYNTLIK